MWSRLTACTLIAGCSYPPLPAPGEIAGDAAGGVATDGAGSTGDGSSGRPDCFAHWMDGTIAIDASTVKEITELSSAGDEENPWISSDGLRIYFSRDLMVTGPGDVYFASRDSPTGTFGTPATVPTLNTSGEEGRAWLTSDELSLALSTTHDGPLNIAMTTRPPGQPFGTPDTTHLAMVNARGTERGDPYLTDDLLRLYFTADTGPTSKLQLWTAARSAVGDDFGAPSLVPGINDNSVSEFSPALYQDERLLVFSAFPSTGTADLSYATRSSATSSFGAPVKIPTVNTAFSEIDPVLSADGCELYFASDRRGSKYHLFHAAITK